MSTSTDYWNTVSDAAGLLLAEVRGDRANVTALLTEIAENADLRSALSLLSCLVTVGGQAIAAEVAREAHEDGAVPPSLSYVTAAAGHAGKRAANEAGGVE